MNVALSAPFNQLMTGWTVTTTPTPFFLHFDILNLFACQPIVHYILEVTVVDGTLDETKFSAICTAIILGHGFPTISFLFP